MEKLTELDNTVFSAQSGNEEAMIKVMEQFGWKPNGNYSNFLGKYMDLFLYGKVNLKDKDTRRFLQLYVKTKELRKKLTYHYQDYVGVLVGQEMATYLQNKTENIPKEELEQDLALLFINCIHSYEKTKKDVDFSGYIYNTFRYRVYHYLRKGIFKLDGLNRIVKEEFEIQEAEDPKSIIEPQESWFDRFYASELKRDELGLFWINGRCSYLFEDLNVFERTVLRDRYFLSLTDGDIAKKYGYHINTIYKKRHRALEKLTNKKRESFS